MTTSESHSRSSSRPSSPHTPPPASPNVRITLPTPPSFLAHRSRASEGVDMERRHSSALSDTDITTHATSAEASTTLSTRQEKRPSISSLDDPVVQGNEKRDRRVSFSQKTQVISRPTPVSTAIDATIKSEAIGDEASLGGLKSPVYKIPQRQSYISALDTDAEETLASPEISSKTSVTTPLASGRRPLSFQGLSPMSGGSPSRLASTAAARGISIAPALRGNGVGRGGAPFRSIWSAGVVPSSKSGWITPSPGLASANPNLTCAKSIPHPTSASTTSGAISPALGSASSVAKQRGLSIAVIKEDGKGVLPITPGLLTPHTGLKSPVNLGGLKSPEVRVLRGLDSAVMNGLPSAKSTGVPGTAEGDTNKKEIILCKFYHTPGLTCTSRPCRFVHNLSSIALGDGSSTAALPTGTLDALVSPRKVTDPTSGVFAQAQMRAPAPSTTEKRLRVREDDVDVGDIQPGERVVVEDENGQEIVGTVFFMSGGGKGAMGKSREKWKTVPCKDFAEGHCPYGDYCSFIHDEKLPAGLLAEDAKTKSAIESDDKRETEAGHSKPTPRLTHRKSASLGSSLGAWTKALPRAQLVPSVTVDPKILKKNENRLSAFAPPYSKQPVTVDNAGDVVPAPPSPVPLSPAPLIENHPQLNVGPAQSEGQQENITNSKRAAPSSKSSAWSKGPPPTLRKMASLKKVTITDIEPSSQLATVRDTNAHSRDPNELKTPTSASHLMPPVSAFSMFGTESDPASPFDPVVHRRKMQELEDALTVAQNQAQSQSGGRYMPRSGLSQTVAFDLVPPTSSPAGAYPMSPTMSSDGSEMGMGMGMGNQFSSSTYPWGMPMSPVTAPGYQDPNIPNIPGGLGVMWTPAGWAVQDAAMKLALRSAEVRSKYGEDIKRRQAKNYFRTRPCKFFSEGFCPHGDECTYLHVLRPPSPDQTTSSDSDYMSSPPKPTSTFKAPKQHPNHRTLPCKFFNSAMGCMNGDSCAFLHTRVVPEAVPLVDRPRPWRTKPCRHFQLGRCTLGDACHFAHVADPAWLASGYVPVTSMEGKEDKVCPAWSRTGRCPDGGNCRYLHIGEGGEGNVAILTEEGLEKTLEEMREKAKRWNEEEEEDDDDVEIVTGMSSEGYSPPSSIRA